MSSFKEEVGKIEDMEKASAYNTSSGSLDQSAKEAKLVRRQDLRIIPLTASIYLLCYLDRSNIGNAKVLNNDVGHDLLTETGMSSYQYTIALMVFLIAYALFEVPSNYMLKLLSPSTWISLLMFSWGALSMGLGGAPNFAAVTSIRFLLGAVEAGLFPGLVYYCNFWYRPNERSLRVAIILASATLAGAFGGAIAYGVGHMDGVNGLSAWRWLFILEGAPSCASAFLIYFFLPNYPEQAKWLSAEEKALAAERLRGSEGVRDRMTWQNAKATLTEWRLYMHYAIYFGISVPFSSLSLFTPSLTTGLGFESLEAQLMTVPPYAVAYVVTLLGAWSADRFNARALHSAALAAVGAVGFLVSAVLPPDAFITRYVMLIVAASGSFGCIPPLLGWLSATPVPALGLAIAMNISFGAPGQITGVWIYTAEEAARGYPTGHGVNAGLLFFVAIGCLVVRSYYRYKNAQGNEDLYGL